MPELGYMLSFGANGGCKHNPAEISEHTYNCSPDPELMLGLLTTKTPCL
jgi:hypothetical protein